jgi:hypothetical protein
MVRQAQLDLQAQTQSSQQMKARLQLEQRLATHGLILQVELSLSTMTTSGWKLQAVR